MTQLNELLVRVKNLTTQEKLQVLKIVLLDLDKEYPEQEIVICNSEKNAIRYCVPADQYVPVESAEMLAGLRERAELAGKPLTVAALIGYLDQTESELP